MTNKKNHIDKGTSDTEFGDDFSTIVKRFPDNNYIHMKAYNEIYGVLEGGALEGVDGNLDT